MPILEAMTSEAALRLSCGGSHPSHGLNSLKMCDV